MLQSRIKMLEKLPVLEPVVIELGVTLKFSEVRLNDEVNILSKINLVPILVNEYKFTGIERS